MYKYAHASTHARAQHTHLLRGALLRADVTEPLLQRRVSRLVVELGALVSLDLVVQLLLVTLRPGEKRGRLGDGAGRKAGAIRRRGGANGDGAGAIRRRAGVTQSQSSFYQSR